MYLNNLLFGGKNVEERDNKRGIYGNSKRSGDSLDFVSLTHAQHSNSDKLFVQVQGQCIRILKQIWVFQLGQLMPVCIAKT